MINSDVKLEDRILRQKAEELLKKKPLVTSEDTNEIETTKLLHELEVYQIELELQNEELLRAKEQSDIAAEEKYFRLYNFAPFGYVTLSPDCEIQEINIVGIRMLNREYSRLINSRFGFFVSEDTRSVFNDFFEKILKNKRKEKCEVVLIPDLNNKVYVHLEGVICENSNQCFLTMVDVSEQKQLEIELTLSKEKAIESDRLKSAFLANMSHEIRTPMNGILGFAELLKEYSLTGEKQKEYINIIEKSGERMLNIINNLIDISKVEAGLMKVNISECNITQQMKFIYAFFNPEVEAKGMKLYYENFIPSNEFIVFTDREKVYAILTNLVKNAIKFSDRGSIEMGYILEDHFLKFFVKDTGIGIAKDRLEAIFDRFIQADISDQKAFQGAGLGLAITKAYVEMLGGRFWVESKLGEGSVFYFTIPYKPVLKEVSSFENADPVDEKDALFRNLKILIAEDDEASDLYITLTLNQAQENILHAKNGIEAVELCCDNPDIDLILMDLKMPLMDGYEAVRQIRQFNKEVVIIAQTAFGLQGDREKALEAGCNDYITKPIKKGELMSLIHRCFNN